MFCRRWLFIKFDQRFQALNEDEDNDEEEDDDGNKDKKELEDEDEDKDKHENEDDGWPVHTSEEEYDDKDVMDS